MYAVYDLLEDVLCSMFWQVLVPFEAFKQVARCPPQRKRPGWRRQRWHGIPAGQIGGRDKLAHLSGGHDTLKDVCRLRWRRRWDEGLKVPRRAKVLHEL